VYVAFASHPPLGEALYRTIWPEKIDAMKIVTLVGGLWVVIFLLPGHIV
jgi:hypothetical protein